MKDFEKFLEEYYKKNPYLPSDDEKIRMCKDMMIELLKTYHEWINKKD